MGKLIAPIGVLGGAVLVGAAVWFVLFVILGIGLGTAFIAGGCALAACVLAAGLALFDAPLTTAGLLLGIATFAILEVVLSVPLWVDVISGLGVMGLYDTVNAAIRPAVVGARPGATSAEARSFAPLATSPRRGSHDREPVGAR